MNALPVHAFDIRPALFENFSLSVDALVPANANVALMLTPPTAASLKRRTPHSRRISARRPADRSWRELQCALPFSLPPKIVTPLMQRVLDVVIRTASAKIAMPTNQELGAILGRGRQSVAKAFDRLVALGRLRVDSKHGYRRVLVVGKAIITTWGEHRLGHAPYSKNAKGTVPVALPVVVPQPIGRAGGFAFLGVARGHDFAFKQAILGSTAQTPVPRSCQYITSPDEAYWPEFCGAHTLSGKSWCLEHYSIVFRK